MAPTDSSLTNISSVRGCERTPLIVPLEIESIYPTAEAQPIAIGVPFSKGALFDPDGLALLGDDDLHVPIQTQALARWSDGSVQWLLVEFLANLPEAGQFRYALRQRTVPESITGVALRIEELPHELIIDTGVVRFHLDRRCFRPFHRVLVDGNDLIDGASTLCLLTPEKGGWPPCFPSIERSTVETQGPVRATIRFDGTWDGRVPIRFTARISVFAGTGLVQLRLTIHNPWRARHPGGLWDLGDASSMFFRELSLMLSLSDKETARVYYTAEAGQSLQDAGTADLEIYQDSSGGENWQSRNHINRHGQVPCSFRGYRVRSEKKELLGLRACPVVSVAGANGCITAAVPEFWQQFPKALEVRDGQLRIGFFPRQFNDLFELQGGEQKTHTVWLHFGPPGSSPQNVLDWVHHPAHIRLDAGWYQQSGAVSQLSPAESEEQLDTYLLDVVQGGNSLFARREIIDEYGWRNFGEVYADHEGIYYNGPAPVISHYNNQYDQVYGALLQYWRTGNSRWLELADPLARHVIDIDIYHTDEDRAVYNGGLFWFTDHYKDAATSTHRTYSRANCSPGDRLYGGGPGSCHNFTTGLLYYHYHTGDPLARDAVLSLADWVMRMDDGRLNVLGLIDDGPTGVASATAEPDYHGPGRGAGLSINALLDGWLISRRRGYLDKAEELIRRCVHPVDDIAARELMDVERRWSYTIFFAALARYLDTKAEANELDYMYAYAQTSLIHYAAWMLENERPYFDQRDKLEYPTEAWAGQEFRKANVLRLAAAHTDEPLRGRLLRRGMELANRAWSDLLRFETRYTARAIAIVLVEGARDSFFRTQGVAPFPQAPHRFDFGSPTVFVPQKLRVRRQLQTPSGLMRAMVNLANPRRWWTLARRRL